MTPDDDPLEAMEATSGGPGPQGGEGAAAATVEADLVLVNIQGLHARPSQLVVKTASAYSATITLSRDDLEVDAKSIMGVMMLAAEKGSVLRVRARGGDAGPAVEALRELFASGFGEEI